MDYLPQVKREPNPQEKSNFLSQLFFLYTIQLFRTGYERDLENKDLYEVPSLLKSKNLGEQFETLLSKQQTKKKKGSILRLLLQCHGTYYLLLGISQVFVKITVKVLRLFLVSKFAAFFVPNQTDVTRKYASLYALSLVVSFLVESWYDQWYSFKLMSLEIQIRAALNSLFYRKTLKLPSLDTEDSIGKIVTLITKDVYNVQMFIRTTNDIWVNTCEAIVLFYLLFQRIGSLVFVPVALATLLLPLQVGLAIKSTTMKTRMLKETDRRLQLTKDILSSITIIKMYTWEKFFKTKLVNLRNKEMEQTYKIFLLKFVMYVNGTVWTCASFFPWMAIFTALGKPTQNEIVFFMFDTYRTISQLLIVSIPHSLCQVAQNVATIQRIDEFLNYEEVPTLEAKTGRRIVVKDVGVAIKRQRILRNVNLHCEAGLTLMIGAVGSGKSVLLKTLLGDCECTKGEIVTEGSISFASQKPWLFAATIRQNILFGEEFNDKRYNQVVAACDLINDFQWFENGDQTVVESHGFNLSKGQRVRINLARAVYKNSDIYLLDDPLAPLDCLSKGYVFKECIEKLLREKLVLLVTRNTTFQHFPNYLLLDDGKVVSSKIRQVERCAPPQITEFIEVEDTNDKTPLLSSFQIDEEATKTGAVEYRVYTKWIRAGGGVTYFLFLSCLLIFLPTAMRYFDKTIKAWSLNEEDISDYIQSNSTETRIFNSLLNKRKNLITAHMIIILVVLILTLVSSLCLLSFARAASVKLHTFLVEAVLHADLHFFASNIFGNILNRVSRDLLNIEEVLPFLFYDSYKIIIPLILSIIPIVSVEKIYLVPLLFLLLILISLRGVYLTVGRSLKRLEASTKSPVVGYFNATLEGLTTIRARKCDQILQDEFDRHQDLHTSASYTYLCTTRAFSLCVSWTSSLFLGAVISRFLIVGVDPSSVSLATYQTLFLVQILTQAFLNWAEIETYMTSVERIVDLTQIKQESRDFLNETWIQGGEIKFENVSNEKLRNLSFVIRPKEKIGIVGRSGSGKSVLVYALFRLSDFEGRICVNGADIRSLSLEFLRGNISVISQEVVVFRGSIRENVDPARKHLDTEIWKALEAVGLKKIIWDLDVEIYEKFYHFDARQEFLLCLAKVILESNDILVIDNIDQEVEILVCNMIKTTFLNCTVVVVTNSLQIISDCDKVMVLDEGQIVEFDSPSKLSANKSFLQNLRPIGSEESQCVDLQPTKRK